MVWVRWTDLFGLGQDGGIYTELENADRGIAGRKLDSAVSLPFFALVALRLWGVCWQRRPAGVTYICDSRKAWDIDSGIMKQAHLGRTMGMVMGMDFHE